MNVPEEIKGVAETLQKSGFQAYLVGGCVRDLLFKEALRPRKASPRGEQAQGRIPKDWDIATNALPEEVLKLFPDSVYENQFGTVLVKIQDTRNKIQTVEVTTFRKEGKYTDKRHPDEVKFAKTIEEDLGRRDFTINAMALKLEARNVKHETSEEDKCSMLHASGFTVTDPYGGQADLKQKLIRAVGKPEERFQEDALRLMRAVRFGAELGFEIEEKTAGAIAKLSDGLKHIAIERIRDEFVKLIMAGANTNDTNAARTTRTLFSIGAARGTQILEDFGLLKHIIPELREGIGCGQNLHHIYTVWEHSLRALDYAAAQKYGLEIRLGALFHDVGKPRAKRGEGKHSTFYGHEVVGARMVKKIMERLKFSREVSEKVTHLVRYHMFFYNTGEVSDAGVRRFLARVGVENIDDLIKIREADRIGSGVPKAKPYKIRHLLFMIDKVRRDPITPKMLKVNGEDIMKILDIPPGPRVGWVLSALMDEVLEEPKRNTIKDLGLRIKEFGKFTDGELRELAKRGKEKIEEAETGAEEEMKKRHHV